MDRRRHGQARSDALWAGAGPEPTAGDVIGVPSGGVIEGVTGTAATAAGYARRPGSCPKARSEPVALVTCTVVGVLDVVVIFSLGSGLGVV